MLESIERIRTAFCKSFTNILRAGKSSREIPSITLVTHDNIQVSNETNRHAAASWIYFYRADDSW